MGPLVLDFADSGSKEDILMMFQFLEKHPIIYVLFKLFLCSLEIK